MALVVTVGACVGSPIKWCASGASGYHDVIVKAWSHGPASTTFWPGTHCLQSGSSMATPPRAKLSREEPDAGNLHVRVCEGWGWRHPHLLGSRRSNATSLRSSDSQGGRGGGPAQRCRRSAAPHRLAPSERAAGWTDAVQAPGRSAAPTVSTRFEHGRCRRGGARGLVVSPCSLSQDHLVQRQIRDCPPKTGVLRLQILHPLDLIAPQPAVLLTPAIIRHLRDADGADRIGHQLALRRQHINLAQLRHDLFRLVMLPRNFGPPLCPKTYLRADQFIGGGSQTPPGE